jgi:hypothetical protein
MRLLAALFSVAIASALLSGCHPPEVVQGTVVRVDADRQVVVVRHDLPPNDECEYAIAGAALNVPPAAGDVVRIAYHRDGDRRIATRVMNVSPLAGTRDTTTAH